MYSNLPFKSFQRAQEPSKSTFQFEPKDCIFDQKQVFQSDNISTVSMVWLPLFVTANPFPNLRSLTFLFMQLCLSCRNGNMFACMIRLVKLPMIEIVWTATFINSILPKTDESKSSVRNDLRCTGAEIIDFLVFRKFTSQCGEQRNEMLFFILYKMKFSLYISQDVNS